MSILKGCSKIMTTLPCICTKGSEASGVPGYFACYESGSSPMNSYRDSIRTTLTQVLQSALSKCPYSAEKHGFRTIQMPRGSQTVFVGCPRVFAALNHILCDVEEQFPKHLLCNGLKFGINLCEPTISHEFFNDMDARNMALYTISNHSLVHICSPLYTIDPIISDGFLELAVSSYCLNEENAFRLAKQGVLDLMLRALRGQFVDPENIQWMCLGVAAKSGMITRHDMQEVLDEAEVCDIEVLAIIFEWLPWGPDEFVFSVFSEDDEGDDTVHSPSCM